MAHWAKIMADGSAALRTILVDGRVAGNIACWEDSGVRKVGYWLGREHWGRGIATAALSRFVDRVVARPLVAHVAKHNVASVRVLQKCGFTITGEERFLLRDEEYCDDYILTLAARAGTGPDGTGESPA